MKDFITKIDDDATDAGVVVADEYNSIFTEAKNAVKTFLALNSTDNKQLQKAIDIASKAMFYTDAGTANSVQLIRGATTETTETLFDGMVVYFLPSNANTGATTLKVTTLTAKPLFYNGANLPAGYLNTTSKYVAVYDATNDRFNVDVIAGGSAEQPYKVKDAVNADEAVSKSQVDGNYVGSTDGTVNNSMKIVGINPDLKFIDTDGVDFWLRTNGDIFHILVDKDGNGVYDTDETPLTLSNTTKSLVIYGSTAWTSGNDGAGSLLDADKLDGYDSNVSAVANTVPLRDADTAIAGKNQCTAWVNFDGTDGTIRSSFNVGSVVRVGTGLYDINFATAMTNADYAVSGTSCYAFDGSDNNLDTQIAPRRLSANPFTTTKAQIVSSYGDTIAFDGKLVTVMFFGGK